jgi:class 3 adenylate cyclase
MKRFCTGCGSAAGERGRFCGECGEALPAMVAVKSTPPAQPGERRQISFLMADLVGSTRLLQQVDAEDLIEMVAEYHRDITAAVERFGGRIARFEGDAAVAFFGYPEAMEDCAAAAVRAALAIVALVSEIGGRQSASGALPKGVGLDVRVGVETGQVTISGAPTASGRIEDTFFAGPPPNMAARLQTIAPVGGVAVGPTTRRLAGDVFEWHSLGVHMMKGFPEPIEAHHARAEISRATRMERRLARTRTPMINRTDELRVLGSAWEDARGGQVRGVVISGEAGIGKSRVLHSFQDRISDHAPIRLSLQCLQTLTNTAMFPHIDLLERLSGIADGDRGETRLARLRTMLVDHGLGDDEPLLLIAEMMSIPAQDLPPLLMSGPLRRARTFNAIITLLRHIAASAPVVMVYEDIHWLDQTSLDLLGQIVAISEPTRLLVIATTRPGHEGLVPGAVGLPLTRLSGDHCREMVRALSDDAKLPPGVFERIVARTDGVPLFLMELTQMVVKGGEQELPETLLGLLTQRLDQLGAARQLAQVGAIIGREFDIGVAAALMGQPEAVLGGAVAALIESGLAQPTARPGVLIFKHALVQEAAEATILPRRQRQLHGQMATLLIASGDDAEPEAVARHLAVSGADLQAADWWLRAARQSIGRGAMVEASTHFRTGLAGLEKRADELDVARARTELLAGLGPTLMVMFGPGAEAFGTVQRQAFELMRTLPERPMQFPITYGVALYHWGRAELQDAAHFADVLAKAATDAGNGEDAGERTMAANNMGAMVAFHRGDANRARALLRRSVGLYEPERHAALYPSYMMDFGVFGRFYLALAEHFTDDSDLALETAAAAETLARKLGQPHSVGFAMLAHFIVHALRGEAQSAHDWATRCAAYAAEQGFPEFLGMAQVVIGWSEAQLGKPEQGLAMLEQGITLWQRTGFENWQSWFGALRAGVLAQMGRGEAALAVIAEQRARIAQSGELIFEGSLAMVERHARAVAAAAE